MPAFLEKQKLVIGAGLGVAIAASTAFAAYVWFDKNSRAEKSKISEKSPNNRSSRKREESLIKSKRVSPEKSSLKRKSSQPEIFEEPECSSSAVESSSEEESTVEIMAETRRGGRIHYRRQNPNSSSPQKSSTPEPSEQQQCKNSDEQIISPVRKILSLAPQDSISFPGKSISWSEEVEKSQMEEALSRGFQKFCRTEADGSEYSEQSRTLSSCNEEEEELKRVLQNKQMMRPGLHQHHQQHVVSQHVVNSQFVSQISPGTKQPGPIESPSLGSDIVSEASQDSGRGGSCTGPAGSMSPVEEIQEIEPPPFYEFEVPQSIVGLIIGKKGVTIKQLQDRSGAHIVIRHHWFKDNFKICTLEGTRDQINKCLRTIRRMFPPSRFPELNLNPLLPPPVTSPVTSMWESLIRLTLPDGVRTEAVVSSMVDAGHVFLQQPTHPSFQYLTKLDQFMLAVYSQHTSSVPELPKPIELGVVCAAPVLNGWYRAQTMCYYEEDDEVLVRFEDYGGYSRLPASDLRQIRSDFMNIPFQATECYMAHVTPVEEEGWSIEACELLSNLAMTSVIEAKVVGYAPDSLPLVELYCTINGEEFDINKTLFEEGYAHYVEPDLEDSVEIVVSKQD